MAKKRELTDVQAYIVDRLFCIGAYATGSAARRFARESEIAWRNGNAILMPAPAEIPPEEKGAIEVLIDLANFQATRDRGNTK